MIEMAVALFKQNLIHVSCLILMMQNLNGLRIGYFIHKQRIYRSFSTMDSLKPYDGELETLEELIEIVNELRKDLNVEMSQASGNTLNKSIA
ncbi:hypothetical protein [Ligilactobacillus agilis]|uniref:hypothetical protein n=1 Tax=Ligilactobacillus agilis TaxID=1601 RepID=UPI003D809CE1